jgi:hypothetical protein
MASTQPGSSSGHAASATPALRYPRCPRRWGRLLVAGLTLVLVAALVPRALADTGDGRPFGFDPFGLESTQQVPTVAAAETGGEGEGGGDGREVTAGARQASEQDGGVPETPDSGADTGDPRQVGVAQDGPKTPEDQLAAAQNQLSDPAGCAGDGCPAGPATPRVPTAADTRGGTGSSRGDDRQELINQQIGLLEQELGVWEPDQPVAADRYPTSEDYARARRQGLVELLREIEGLEAEVVEGHPGYDRLAEAKRRAQEILRTLPNPMISVESQTPTLVTPQDQRPVAGTPPSKATVPPAGPGPYTSTAPPAGLPPMQTLGPAAATLGVGALVLAILGKCPTCGLVVRQALPSLFPTSTPGGT